MVLADGRQTRAHRPANPPCGWGQAVSGQSLCCAKRVWGGGGGGWRGREGEGGGGQLAAYLSVVRPSVGSLLVQSVTEGLDRMQNLHGMSRWSDLQWPSVRSCRYSPSQNNCPHAKPSPVSVVRPAVAVLSVGSCWYSPSQNGSTTCNTFKASLGGHPSDRRGEVAGTVRHKLSACKTCRLKSGLQSFRQNKSGQIIEESKGPCCTTDKVPTE